VDVKLLAKHVSVLIANVLENLNQLIAVVVGVVQKVQNVPVVQIVNVQMLN
tara:strand:+ start:180 stop:332 length:153 start_codon:yes stop_codon:yes gene_type:complete